MVTNPVCVSIVYHACEVGEETYAPFEAKEKEDARSLQIIWQVRLSVMHYSATNAATHPVVADNSHYMGLINYY